MNSDLSQSATQPCSEVKTKAMKDKVGIVSLKDGPLKSTIATILEHEVLKHCGIFHIRIQSGQFFGNYTFPAVKGTESYLLLQTSLKDVRNDINSLLENQRIVPQRYHQHSWRPPERFEPSFK